MPDPENRPVLLGAVFFKIYPHEGVRRLLPGGTGIRSRAVGRLFRFVYRWLDIYPYQELVIRKL